MNGHLSKLITGRSHFDVRDTGRYFWQYQCFTFAHFPLIIYHCRIALVTRYVSLDNESFICVGVRHPFFNRLPPVIATCVNTLRWRKLFTLCLTRSSGHSDAKKVCKQLGRKKFLSVTRRATRIKVVIAKRASIFWLKNAKNIPRTALFIVEKFQRLNDRKSTKISQKFEQIFLLFFLFRTKQVANGYQRLTEKKTRRAVNQRPTRTVSVFVCVELTLKVFFVICFRTRVLWKWRVSFDKGSVTGCKCESFRKLCFRKLNCSELSFNVSVDD